MYAHTFAITEESVATVSIVDDTEHAALFTVQEQDPKRFWTVFLDGSLGGSFSGQRLPIRDLSGIYYERANGLFVLHT